MLTREEELELESLEFVEVPEHGMELENLLEISKKVNRKCELLAKKFDITEEQAYKLLQEQQKVADGFGDYLINLKNNMA